MNKILILLSFAFSCFLNCSNLPSLEDLVEEIENQVGLTDVVLHRNAGVTEAQGCKTLGSSSLSTETQTEEVKRHDVQIQTDITADDYQNLQLLMFSQYQSSNNQGHSSEVQRHDSEEVKRDDAQTQTENASFLQNRDIQMFALGLISAVVIGGITYYVYKRINTRKSQLKKESIEEFQQGNSVAQVEEVTEQGGVSEQDLGTNEANLTFIDDDEGAKIKVVRGVLLSMLGVMLFG
jgi:preprotein translocase subunit YajC